MKKAMLLSVSLLLLCLFIGCGMQPESSSHSASKASAAASTATTSTTASASEGPTTTVDIPLGNELNSAVSSKSNQSSSSLATACIHNYVKKVVAPTCTKQGYTLHTCNKCGKSYKDSYIAARHDYGKYLCLNCGRPDPDRPIYSLSAWLEKNGVLAGNGIYTSINYKKDGATYSIYANKYCLDYIDFDLEKGEEIFRIALDNTDQCSICYFHDLISGSTKLKKSEVCSSIPLKLNSFENNGSVVCSKQEFAAQMSSKIDDFLKVIQDKLLYPRTGLKLRNYGFKVY